MLIVYTVLRMVADVHIVLRSILGHATKTLLSHVHIVLSRVPELLLIHVNMVELRGGRHQIVPSIFGKMQEGFVDDAAHGMKPSVMFIGVAAPVPVPSRQGINRARFQGLPVYVL